MCTAHHLVLEGYLAENHTVGQHMNIITYITLGRIGKEVLRGR